jgi:ATP-dependent DNA helicase RecG
VAQLKLDSPVQYLKGVGPRRASALAGIGIDIVDDLLHYLPRRYIDRSMITPINAIKADSNVTVIGRVLGKGILKGRKQRYEVILGDSTGYVALLWFRGYRYLDKLFKKGDIYAVTGPVTYFQQNQMIHPEIERIAEDDDKLLHSGRIVPVYPSTSDLKTAFITGKIMRQIVHRAVETVAQAVLEFIPGSILKKTGLMSYSSALEGIHFPESPDQAEKARKRLAFNELLELQFLILSSRREKSEKIKQHKYKKPSETVKSFIENLDFKLTSYQEQSVKEILADMQKTGPMHRLVQGDVGCGKTVVALLAAVYAVENNLQTAFMAPTELLAEQHFQNWREPLKLIGISSALLTGSLNKKDRSKIIEKVKKGEISIIFGTHAVISEPVEFSKLGLIVIDEQHRFGVMQRGRLVSKGADPDTLVMTATPIPRTLALTLYGDLDVSSIKGLPPGRKPIRTVWRTANARNEIYDYLTTKLDDGDQVFFIYPLIEKSEKLDLQAAEEAYEKLSHEVFTDYKVGLIHGKIKAADREDTIGRFRNCNLDILVATTVIEVGLDIPSASVMVIEHAERFGLSQLHQLRGRVGRGEIKGMAIAIATPPLSDLAKKRLNMFQASTDGFKIAEADLELRGPGEFFGTRQHGLPELKIANLSIDTDLLLKSRHIIASLLEPDKRLNNDETILLNYLQNKATDRKKLTRYG